MEAFGKAPSPSLPRSEVLPGLFLGDWDDALGWSGPIVTVHEAIGGKVPGAHWLPILYGSDEAPKASRLMLDAASCVIRHYQRQKTPVLVHCAVGVERSPLLVAWYLVKYQYAKTLDQAYDMVRAVRPQVQDRTLWLEPKDKP